MHAGGGTDEFLEEHAVIVMSDHSQIAGRGRVNLAAALDHFDVLLPDGRPEDAEIAVCPSQRSAQVYVLDHDAASGSCRELAARPLPASRASTWSPHMADGEAVVRRRAAASCASRRAAT